MGLLTKLKSLLGLEDDRSQVRRSETGVTIEREPDESAEPDEEVESAVEGVDTGAEVESFETEETATETEEAPETAEPEPAETDTSAEDVTTAPEAESAESQEDEATEPAEAVQPSEDAAEPSRSAVDEVDEVGEGEPLDDIKGIGPAYAERLRDAGVADVTELAEADADMLAEETGLSEKRISTWIDRAQAR